MRIVCPSCQARYEVPESLLAAGRPVRCARCGQEWMPAPEDTAPDHAPSAAPPARLPPPSLPGPPPGRSAPRLNPAAREAWPPKPSPADWPVPPPRERRSGRGGAIVGWIVSLVVLALLAWAAYAWRGEVMTVWPPSARAYSAIGLVAPPVHAPPPR